MPPRLQKGDSFEMSTLLKFIIGFGIVLLIVFLYSIFTPGKSASVTSKGPFPLTPNPADTPDKTIIIGESDTRKIFLNDYDEAVQMFVYLDGNIRMGQTVDGGSSGPNPISGMYGDCKCVDINCDNCQHNGYRNLINIQRTFKIEILKTPDASRQESVSTQLYVKTLDNGTYGVESHALPPIPEQKWTMITISKQGRQIFVYYNDRLVLSKRAQKNFSTTLTACPAVRVGDITLSGSAVMFTYFTSHQTQTDVENVYRRMTDTRGNVLGMQIVATSKSYEIVDMSNVSVFTNFVKTLCFDLSCFFPDKREVIPVIPAIYSVETVYQ